MKTDRCDRYSALVLVAALTAIVAIAWITNSPPQKSIEYIAPTDAQKSKQEYIAQLIAAINNPWSDSYAQWIVAITSLVAIIVSSWAVFLVGGYP